jgi:hypothetical protein
VSTFDGEVYWTGDALALPSRPYRSEATGLVLDLGAVSGRYRMRGLATAGPGVRYVQWIVEGPPDVAGVQAPEAVVAGSVVVVATYRRAS